jgi:RNA polymerase sigma-70 factor (ECF subfamily)
MDVFPPEELVRQCRQAPPGDLHAFEALVRQYKGRVFATAYRLMGNREDAEDMGQEVFLKIYRGLNELAEPATLTSWIYRVTTNTCLDALTKRQRRPRTIGLEPPDADSTTATPQYADTGTLTPEEAALQRELRQCLEATLAELDPAGRAVLVLRDVEGRSYQEIADSLILGLSAVKMRIHRARLTFRHVLSRLCPGVSDVDPAPES